MLLPMLALTGCGRSAYALRAVSGTYVRANSAGLPDDVFTITLSESGRFTYYESSLSSHIGMGLFTVEDGVVTLVEKWTPPTDGISSRTYRFRFQDDKLIFIAEGSDEFAYIKLGDGAEFTREK